MSKHLRIFIFIAAISLSIPSAEAQRDTSTLSDTLPLDGSIRHGMLPNGFTYFLKSIPRPEPKLILNLYVKAGTSQEDPYQQSFGHAVEHLAFKATKNFPLRVRYSNDFLKTGMSSNDFSAMSGVFTHYYFKAPPHNNQAIDVGLAWFKDIATDLTMNEEDIGQVRGELRMEYLAIVGNNLNYDYAESKLKAQIFPCENQSSNLLGHIETFNPSDLKSFYEDWYRPDLMAISIVGNIGDMDELEQRVIKKFSDIPLNQNREKLPDCNLIYFNRSPQFYIVEREIDSSKLIPDRAVHMELIFRDSTLWNNLHSKKGIERLITHKILIEILRERLKNATTGYNSFYAGVRNTYQLEKSPAIMKIIMSLEKIEVRQALQKTMQVIVQLQKYGVSETEWNRIRKEHIQNLKIINDSSANYWVNEIGNYYNYGEALPAYKNDYLKKWLSNLSLKEFNYFVGQILLKEPEDIGIIAPRGHNAFSLNENEVRSLIKDSYREQVQPFQMPVTPTNLLDPEEIERLKSGKIIENGVGNSGAREYIFKNGVKLILFTPNPTSVSHNGQIKIHGFSLKGAGNFPQEKCFSAINAPNIVRNAGVNGLDKFEINRFLLNNKILPGVVSQYIDLDETGIQATTTVENIEIILQLIYLYFTKPNKNMESFEDWKINQYKINKNILYIDFLNSVKAKTGENSLLTDILGKKVLNDGSKYYKGIEKTNLDDAYNIYGKLFGDAKDFTFVVTADSEIDEVLPLFKKYLSNLPNSLKIEASRLSSTNNHLEKGPLFEQIPIPGNYEMDYAKYSIRFLQNTSKSDDWKKQINIESLAGIFNQKIGSLRNEKNYSLYSVIASGKYDIKMDRYEIITDFDCRPEELLEIREEVHHLISEVKSGKVTEDLFQQGMKDMYNLYDPERPWRGRDMHQVLYNHYRYGKPWVDPAEVQQYIKGLTIKDIVKTANEFFVNENLYEFVMGKNKFSIK